MTKVPVRKDFSRKPARSPTDMHWVKAETGNVHEGRLYLVQIECGRPARDVQIMAGRTIRVCLEAYKNATGIGRLYVPKWVAEITRPDGGK